MVDDYAIQTRYPGGYTPIGEEEYNFAIIVAEKCVQWIGKKIKELLKKAEEDKNQLYFDNMNK